MVCAIRRRQYCWYVMLPFLLRPRFHVMCIHFFFSFFLFRFSVFVCLFDILKYLDRCCLLFFFFFRFAEIDTNTHTHTEQSTTQHRWGFVDGRIAPFVILYFELILFFSFLLFAIVFLFFAFILLVIRFGLRMNNKCRTMESFEWLSNGKKKKRNRRKLRLTWVLYLLQNAFCFALNFLKFVCVSNAYETIRFWCNFSI